MPLLQRTADDAKDGVNYGKIVQVFGYWTIIGTTCYGTCKGRDYLYRRESGTWNECQSLQEIDGSDVDWFGQSEEIH